MKHQDIIDRLTLKEKAGLCSGLDFWHFKGIERLGLPSITVTDGPHGLRKKAENVKGVDLKKSVPTTCFPTACTSACSWDRELLYQMGCAMGEECLKEKVSVILGPGVNMKRSPLCGRNFEYFSEDPVLAGELAAALINGVQSKGVGTSLKHFAANSQETRRMTVSSVADERTMREIYLTAFEIAVKKAQPWTVMCAYNRINGTYCSDSGKLQNEILRDEWGFEGLVVTDWGAANDRVKGLQNGCDVEMPSSGGYNDKKIEDAVLCGSLDEKVLDKAVDRVLDVILKSKEVLGEYGYSADEHHALARKIASHSAVLLKNEENILPLDGNKTVAVIGEMAVSPRYQGAGSSCINPTKLDNALEELKKAGISATYSRGYDKKTDEVSDSLIVDACTKARKADIALLFIGRTEIYEGEGYDRKHMRLPVSHIELAKDVIKANPNTVVVLSGGSPVETGDIQGAKAIVYAGLGGQASGSAIADVLTGAVNPSGKLAETYPEKLEDTPCYKYFPGFPRTVEYREGLYIGYRYYDTAKKAVAYPFGYGLSYTAFSYSGMRVSRKNIKDGDSITVSFKVKNTGDIAGEEICQLYVRDVQSTAYRPEKELKGFEKIHLEPGEEKSVKITLDRRAFAFWNTQTGNWCVESGLFEILVGASSRDIRLKSEVNVAADECETADLSEKLPSYYSADVNDVSDAEFEALLSEKIPKRFTSPDEELTLLSTLEDARMKKWGRRIVGVIDAVTAKVFDPDDPNSEMVKVSLYTIPIRNMVTMSAGVLSEEAAKGMLMILNGKKGIQGLGKLIGGVLKNIKNIKNLSM
ncbi:MAG: glycoside hydrolase family 3 C-terminal domain-containing protein [Clostridia bacterium]|nr:glycoside hydrolase family 3 C-terminal domain-containing protein [Clostridia bacterium]